MLSHHIELMKRTIFGLIGAFVLVAVTGAFSDLRAQTVSGSIGSGTVLRGKASRATVVLSIPGGLHVNSSRPGSEYQIPTSVRATASGARVGAVTYPRGVDRKFAFSEGTINVYQGRTAFWFNVTVPAGFKGNSISVRIAVKYQACSEEVCYPPKTKEVTLTAKVK
jgi:thiol:disulfide interchange protein